MFVFCNKKLFKLILITCLVVSLSVIGLSFVSVPFAQAKGSASDKLAIVYTNDTHAHIIEEKNDSGQLIHMGFAYVKGFIENLRHDTAYDDIQVVSCGDDISGGLDFGFLSKGQWVVDVMNEVGYDVVTPGNHEFDYGVDQLSALYEDYGSHGTSCISTNFYSKDPNTGSTSPIYAPYCIKTFGDKKIAYVGISTPESLIKSSPKNFINADGQYIYTFFEDESGQALYDQVQSTIDNVIKTEHPNLIVAVGHTGNDDNIIPRWNTENVISHTHGIDLYLDGHSHQVFEEKFKNSNGKEIPALQTGTALENIGLINVDFSGESPVIDIKNYDCDEVLANYDEAAYHLLNDGLLKTIAQNEKEMVGRVIGSSEVELSKKNRRTEENIIGNFCADAYKFIFKTDIGLMNSGGIRDDLHKGDVTVGSMMNINSFSNELVAIQTPGQRILDALEFGAIHFPDEGNLYQVSGMSYDINLDVESSVVLDASGNMIDITGDRRVQNVKVNGFPIDPNKMYSVAASCYVLTDKGEGQTAFSHGDSKIISSPGSYVDNKALCDYLTTPVENGGLGGLISAAMYGSKMGRINAVHNSEPKPVDSESDLKLVSNVESNNFSLATADDSEVSPITNISNTGDFSIFYIYVLAGISIVCLSIFICKKFVLIKS